MKNIFRLFILALIVTSCNEDPEYSLPYELSASTTADITVPMAACGTTITADSESTVYYTVLPEEMDAPTSYQLFYGTDEDGVDNPFDVYELNFDSQGEQEIVLPEDGLDPEMNYVVYAITVNVDGMRTEEVTTMPFTMPTAGEIVDNFVTTDYTGTSFAFNDVAPEFDVTLNADGSMSFSAESLWGPNFVAWAAANPDYNGMFPYPGTITVNEDLSVTVTSDEDYATGGTGYYDPCTNSFHLTLEQAVFTSPFTVDVVLSGN